MQKKYHHQASSGITRFIIIRKAAPLITYSRTSH